MQKASPDSKSTVKISARALPKAQSAESNKSSFVNQDGGSKSSFTGKEQKNFTQKAQACKTMFMNASQSSVPVGSN